MTDAHVAPVGPEDRGPEVAPVSLEAAANLLRGLDPRQRQAVKHGDGPLLVLAGPGTGKTRVVTRRIAWLIATRRARPAEILALTFTGRAANEMQGRVDELVPYGYADTAIHTFHAFGDQLVREHALRLGLPAEPRLLTRPEAVSFLRERLFRLDLVRYRPLGDPTRFLDALVALFGRAKQEAVSPGDWAAFAARAGRQAQAAAGPEREALAVAAAGQAELAAAYATYQALLEEAGCIDFGDQIGLALRLLREQADVRAEVQGRYRYVLVDEFQDTDPAQVELLTLVAGPPANAMVVGDDDQAIYGFRGAALGGLRGFQERFTRARVIVLRRNHRSRRPILEAAGRLIALDDATRLAVRAAPGEPLRAVRRARPLPVVARAFPTTEAEASWVAASIAERLRRGVAPRDHAVLLRANADAVPIMRALSGEGVPWWFSGASGLYQRPVVRDLLAFLRVAADLERSIDLWALATGEPYGLGGPALTLLLQDARRRNLALWAVLEEVEAGRSSIHLVGDSARAVRRLLLDLRAASELAHRRPATEVLYDHLKRSGRLARLAVGGPGTESTLADVSAFFEAIRRLADVLPDPRLPVLVPHLSSLVEAGDDPLGSDEVEPPDAVSVLTVHKAKGLEFPVVFVAGLADGRFPARGRPAAIPFPDGLRRGRDGDEVAGEAPLAEERRLAYVALTRARDELILTWAARGEGRRTRRPSPFLAEALDRAAPSAPDPRLDPTAVSRALASSTAADPPQPGRIPASRLELSFSQLDTYRICPLQYRYRYVIGLPTPAHHLLSFGSAMHAAVAAYHSAEMRDQPLDEVGLEAALRTAWRPEGFLSREHEDARFASGLAALRRFRAERLAAEARPPIAVELPFAVLIDGDRIRGRYDRVDEEPEGLVVTDYKTSDVRELGSATQRARDSLQLAVYALAQAATGRQPAAVQLHFLDSGVVGRVAPQPEALERARATISAVGAGVRAAAFAATPGPFACGHCPYRQICPQSVAP